MTDEPNYDSKTMQPKMGDDPIASPTKDQITGNTVMQKIRSLIDNYLGWSKEITDKVNNLEPGGGGGKTYTAGDGIAISDEDVISNTDHTQTQTNTSDIASIRVSMSDMASSAALGAETEARKSADSTLQTNIDKKQDKLSTAQQSALDSGITATKVQKYDAYDSVKQNTLNTAQMNAVNSGIDAAKVTKYDGYATKITTLEGDMTSVEDSVSALGTQIGAVDTKVDGKQDKLSTAQLNAANSGITASKVTTYDGYATTIAGKQDKLTPGSNITILGNTISATDTKYTLPTASASVLGGVKVGSGLSISNGVLSATGGGGGGASLPADGYYWKRVTADNWNTIRWSYAHAIMFHPMYYQYCTSAWTDSTLQFSGAISTASILYDNVPPVIMEIPDNQKLTHILTPYLTFDYDGAITLNAAENVGGDDSNLWVTASDSTNLIKLMCKAFNSKTAETHIIYTMTKFDLLHNNLMVLTPFS